MLHIAAYADFLEAFIYFSERKNVPLTILSLNSFLPLHYALSCNSLEIVNYIFFKVPNLFTDETQIKNVDHSLLYYAIESNNIRIVQSLFNNGYSFRSQFNSNDLISIVNSTVIKRPSLFSYVIEQIGSSLNPFTKPNNKLSLVMLSIISNNSELVQSLIESGLDEALDSISFDGNIAFFYACFKKMEDAANLILENMKKVEDNILYLNSICYSLCKLCSPSLVKLVLYSGDYNIIREYNSSNVLNVSNEKGVNILKLNSNKDPPLFGLLDDVNLRKENLHKVFKIIMLFLEKGYPIDFQPEGKNTLLGEACLGLFLNNEKPIELIKFLLDNGANPFAIVSVKKIPLFDYLVKMGSTRERKVEMQPLIELFKPYVENHIRAKNEEK